MLSEITESPLQQVSVPILGRGVDERLLTPYAALKIRSENGPNGATSEQEAKLADHHMQGAERPVLVGFYRAWMTTVFLVFIGLGVYFGYTFGVGGSILGAVMGLLIAGMIMIFLNTPEKLEAAIYTTLAVGCVILVIYLIVAFWGVRL